MSAKRRKRSGAPAAPASHIRIRIPKPTLPPILTAADPEEFLEFQLVRSNSPGSRLIGFFGGGFFSHVDIVWPDGRLFGARSDHIRRMADRTRCDLKPGVRFRPQGYERWSRVVRIRVPCSTEQKRRAMAWALEQEYKPYDKLAIVAFAIDRSWRTEGAWFCSELATRYLEVAFDFTLPLTPNKIPPGTFACTAGARPGATITILPQSLKE
ncbi:MAG TPA: hypothetical protein VFX20_18045 [Steroidobacteraceae bacterium]|nr:hypothetical protein [Steroidobacteraceae bacterium]